jgi:hypothetical protein
VVHPTDTEAQALKLRAEARQQELSTPRVVQRLAKVVLPARTQVLLVSHLSRHSSILRLVTSRDSRKDPVCSESVQPLVTLKPILALPTQTSVKLKAQVHQTLDKSLMLLSQLGREDVPIICQDNLLGKPKLSLNAWCTMTLRTRLTDQKMEGMSDDKIYIQSLDHGVRDENIEGGNLRTGPRKTLKLIN